MICVINSHCFALPKYLFKVSLNLSSYHNISLSFYVTKLRLKRQLLCQNYELFPREIYKRSLYKGYSKSEGFVDEQVNNLLLSRKAYIGSLTKIINKITLLLNDENNKNSVINENKKLDVTVSHLRRITSELKELYTDETALNKSSR